MQLAEALRHRVNSGEFVMGTFVGELRTPALARILQQATFDFMLVDNEHGNWNPQDIAQHIDAGKRWGICPLVRVSGPERGEIMRALDAGAEGIMVPMAKTLADVERAVEFSKYPPLGQRGAHFARPHNEFTPPKDIGAYMRAANEQLLTIVQIETEAAVERLDEFAATPGVDVLYLGPGDLSVALGVPGQVDHPRVMEVAERIVAVCRQHGKIAASHFVSVEMLGELRRRGIQLGAFGAAVRMLQYGIGELGSQARDLLKGC
ncbi:MAG: 2-keto-3-deoxy-L-rhamnonate aldolase RhmA [Candidatus Latescibacterota bacterium]|jgi:2-keto-3-deoxy-L-rhamnonate aldolase RhmA